MKNIKRIMMLIMALAMLVSVAACGENGTADDDETPDISADDGFGVDVIGENRWQPPDNFGGRQFVIADWWTIPPPPDAPKRPPKNTREEEIEDLEYFLEEEYGFTFTQYSISDWGNYLEMFTTSIMANSPEADIYIMSSTWAYLMMGQGMLYPLNTLDSIDVSDSKWNSFISDMYTDADGNVYALSPVRYVEPRNFLFYNKRLFQEAGIDPEEPYDLQASGEWTWDKFMEYCNKLTRDTDGDGITDIYGFAGMWGPTQTAFINSNDARHVGVNDDGTFYNAMFEPNFIEAMEFVQRIWDEGHWIINDDIAWNYFEQAFSEGIAAMCIPIGAYQSDQFLSMDDDWGMLYAPKGPRADDYNTMFEENVYVLPFNLDKDRAEEIMYAWNLYTQPIPSESYDGYWKDSVWGYQRYKDARAVDETLTMFYEGRMEINSRILIDPGTTNWWGETFDWGATQNTDMSVIEKIEAAAPVINARINELNGGN